MRPLVTCLWFDTQAEEAAAFYAGLIPNSSVGAVMRYGPAGPGPEGSVMTVDFTVNGQRFTGLNGGPLFPFTEAVSLVLECEDQAEVDHYWDALVEGGGEYVQCGWLKDRFGLSWQVVPAALNEIFTRPDAAGVERATRAMLGMVKIVIADVEAAYNGAE